MSNKKAVPNEKQVTKIQKQLEGLNGLSNIKKLDFVMDGINTFVQGYNIATLAKGFFPKLTEIVNVQVGKNVEGREFPTLEAIEKMKQVLSEFRRAYESRKLVLYPMFDKRDDGQGNEWRYFNMQKLEDYDQIAKLDEIVIRAIKKWVKNVTTILSEDPTLRNQQHAKEKSQITYELMLKRRELRRLEKKKNRQILVNGENQDNETDEK